MSFHSSKSTRVNFFNSPWIYGWWLGHSALDLQVRLNPCYSTVLFYAVKCPWKVWATKKLDLALIWSHCHTRIAEEASSMLWCYAFIFELEILEVPLLFCSFYSLVQAFYILSRDTVQLSALVWLYDWSLITEMTCLLWLNLG